MSLGPASAAASAYPDVDEDLLSLAEHVAGGNDLARAVQRQLTGRGHDPARPGRRVAVTVDRGQARGLFEMLDHQSSLITVMATIPNPIAAQLRPVARTLRTDAQPRP